MEKEILPNPILWSPSEEKIKSSQMFRFLQNINAKYDLNLDSFSELHNWSIENKSEFWSSIWDFFKIIGSKGIEPYIEPSNKMPESKFFPNGTVNYAENMLSADASGPAIIFKSEDKVRKEVSWRDLKSQVASLANFLKKEGVVKGDRVAAYMPNCIETVEAFLATTSIGGIWSSCSPDFGANGVIERFSQIKPKILFITDLYFYNGKKINIIERLSEILKQIPSIKNVVVVSYPGNKFL